MNPFRRVSSEERRTRRSRIRAGDIVVMALVGALLILLYNYSLGEIVGVLYSPIAGLIILIMIAEFLWLKSGDRTRVYKLEVDKLRMLRRRDDDLLRRARTVIDQALSFPETEETPRPADWHRRAMDARKDIDDRL